MKHLLEFKAGYDRLRHLLEPPTSVYEEQSLLDRFLYLVLEGKVGTDDEAVALLYDESKDASYRPYQKLKTKLKIYLPYRLGQLCNPDASEARPMVFKARMCLLWARRCIARHQYKTAEWLLLEANHGASEVEQYRVLREAAGELCELYSEALYDEHKYAEFRTVYASCTELETSVTLLSMYHYTLRGVEVKKYRRSRSHQDDYSDIRDETLAILSRQTGTRIINHGYSILDSIAALNGDWEAAYVYAKEGVEKARRTIYHRDQLLYTRIARLILVTFKLQRFKECLLWIENQENNAFTHVGGVHISNFYKVLSLIALERYDESAIAGKEIDTIEVAKFYSAQYIANFYVVYAYQYVLWKLGLISEASAPKEVSGFRYGRFLNRVAILEQSKQGYNVHLRILELFYLVLDRKYDEFIDQTEAVEKYIIRYLSKPEHARNGLMLRMLVSPVKYNFDAETTEREESGNLEQLLSLDNFAFREDLQNAEFVPYEQLWSLYLKALRKEARTD